jgi:hypothetical protein
VKALAAVEKVRRGKDPTENCYFILEFYLDELLEMARQFSERFDRATRDCT